MFTQIPFQPAMVPQLSRLLAEAYMRNNPYVIICNLTKHQMINDFQSHFQDNFFRIIQVFVDSRQWEQGNQVIVSCWCFADVTDVGPKEEVKDYD